MRFFEVHNNYANNIVILYRVIVGEVDEAIDSRIDFSKIRAEPLPSIVH